MTKNLEAQENPYAQEKIIGTFLPTNSIEVFDGIGEASSRTKIQEGYIRRCIRTGGRWRCWVFDIYSEVLFHSLLSRP